MVKPDSQVVVIDTLQKDMVRSWSPDDRQKAPPRQGSRAAISDAMSPVTVPRPSLCQQDSELPHVDTPKPPHKPQSPVVAVEAPGFATTPVKAGRGPSLGRRVSFDVPKLMQLSTSSVSVSNIDLMRTPSSLPSQAAFLNRQPSEAAHQNRQPSDSAWLNRLPSGLRLSPANRLPPLSIPFEMTPARVSPGHKTMRRSVSLSRLPSQVSDLTPCSLLDSANDDSAIISPRLPSMQPLLHLTHCLSPASGASSHPSHRVTQDAHPLLLPSFSANPLRGLTFTPAGGRYHMDPHEAFTAMCEGSMQCAVTGNALEYLLKLSDVSLLETVLRSAVVFSRMQVCNEADTLCSTITCALLSLVSTR